MRTSAKYSSNIAFIDLLFNTLIGYVFLFILAFILISPPTPKEKMIDPKAEIMIILTWPDGDVNDIDLWVMGPNRNKVGFKNRESGLIHLDRDDRGLDDEQVLTPSGNVITNQRNQEIISVRGWIPGRWTVNVHAYHFKKSEDVESIPVTVELIRTDPYTTITQATYNLTYNGEERTMFNFTVVEKLVSENADPLYVIKHINDEQIKIIDGTVVSSAAGEIH